MSKIFKNMLPYWKGLIIVVALLVVQAWCDLSLPFSKCQVFLMK